MASKKHTEPRKTGRFRAGDDGSEGRSSHKDLKDLFDQFQIPLEKYFRKRVYNQNEVEDLVQDVFFRLTSRSDNTDLERPEAFIFQIAANLLRDKARREATKRAFTKQLSDQNENAFEEISPERVLLGKEKLVALKNALNELPERTRTVFLLHRFEEFKYREIAQQLGMSMSSVEKHMMVAIKHLTQRLGSSE
ncbi:RNA polymerase sigma factor [Parasphingorhabdus litoris]|uniref:RNA polymerase sigma factor n=1 Tax=Parasphingorhabdus litoris TaxID=394733 RepID=UPI001E618E40|nr:RNA polymerase sigma factor [Parasphingorhabdus litoris]